MTTLAGLVLGTLLGVAARHMYGESARLAERETAATERIILEDEIKRLRAQVALHINQGPPYCAKRRDSQDVSVYNHRFIKR